MPNPPDSAEERLHLSSRIKGAAVSGAIMADPRIDIDDRDRSSGGYKVETSLKDDFQPSKVRDQVFERIQHYTDAHSGQLKYVWIDQHCIVQKEGPEKTQGMQAMDLVYGLSGHPISLLARRINSEDVRLLADILEGVFITHMTGSAEFRLSPLAVSSSQVLEDAMKLLEAITSDLWWSRAWTFQEKYLSESKMKLLTPHFSDKELEKEKKHKKKVFGTAVGELCVKSIDFHRQVTQLCLACKKERPNLAASADRILGKASNYEILLRDTAPDAHEWDTDEDWSGEEDAVGQLESEFGSGSSSDSDSESEHSYGFTIDKPESWADEPIYVFTSSKPKEEGSRNSYPNDIDKHVSIEIESQGARLEDGYHRPNLVTKRWINGLCFFRGHPRQEVVFPWHPALTNNRGV
ncbi:hypothetical protein K4K60_008884 [Colletotrichum sp. SAR11_57]|nr:hypothetical protein K4K60_008884 [Colletotrichum sp. SAR11_57]